MDDFKKELWMYIWECGIDVRRNIKVFYSDLKDSELETPSEDIIFNIAYTIAFLTKKALPNHLHSRMILENNDNDWVKKYVDFLEGKSSKALLKID